MCGSSDHLHFQDDLDIQLLQIYSFPTMQIKHLIPQYGHDVKSDMLYVTAKSYTKDCTYPEHIPDIQLEFLLIALDVPLVHHRGRPLSLRWQLEHSVRDRHEPSVP